MNVQHPTGDRQTAGSSMDCCQALQAEAAQGEEAEAESRAGLLAQRQRQHLQTSATIHAPLQRHIPATQDG